MFRREMFFINMFDIDDEIHRDSRFENNVWFTNCEHFMFWREITLTRNDYIMIEINDEI